MTAAMAMTASPQARGQRWLALALSGTVHLLVLALLVALGRFSPAAVTLPPLAMVVEIVALSELVAQRAAAAETPSQSAAKEIPAEPARPEAQVVRKEPAPPPAIAAAKAEAHWISLAPRPPVRPATAKAAGKIPTVQYIARLAAEAANKVPALLAGGSGMAAQGDGAAPRATGSPSPRPVAGNPAPRYPARAQRRGWQGRVLVRLAITGEGRVARVVIAKTSGYALLDRAARRALRNWRFKSTPYAANAKIVAEVTVPVVFRLHGGGGAVVDTKVAAR